MKKIILTGGPCSGKSTVLEELAKMGYPVLRETAKEIVAARRDIPMTKEESQIRQNLIFNEQIVKEDKADKENYNLIFMDRGLIDGLGYSVLYSGEESIQEYLPAVKNRKYDTIFVFEQLPFDSQGFRAVNENEEEARKIRDSICNLYIRLGYQPISVPVMPVKDRVEFILERI